MIAPALPILPPGTPAWITPSLVAETLNVWQPYYDETLTVSDAVDMLLAMGRIAEIVVGPDAKGGEA